MFLNPELLRLASWRIENPAEPTKEAFVAAPPPGAPGPGAGPPPGGPPMPDPSAGGAPPMDPSMMGGGGAPPMPQAPAPAMPGAPMPGQPGADGKPAKPDLATIAMDLYQVKKLVIGFYHVMGLPLPHDILDGPHRHPHTGAAVPPGTPGSTSDPNKPPDPQMAQNALAPPGPMDPASLSAPPPAKAASSDEDPHLNMGSGYGKFVADLNSVGARASAVAAILTRINGRK